MERLEIQPDIKQKTLFIKSYFPMDYDTLNIDLLDPIGNETKENVSVLDYTVNSIRVQLPAYISGIFQVRIRDINNYLVQKIIIQ